MDLLATQLRVPSGDARQLGDRTGHRSISSIAVGIISGCASKSPTAADLQQASSPAEIAYAWSRGRSNIQQAVVGQLGIGERTPLRVALPSTLSRSYAAAAPLQGRP